MLYFNHLIVFTKFPVPGKTKTRLAPQLGQRGAAELHRTMAGKTVLLARSVCSRKGYQLQIRYDNASKTEMKQWLGDSEVFKPQGRGNLGDRMHFSFMEAFSKGALKVVLIGTDCPGLNESVIQNAFDSLESNDLVLGPARDGGYYLIGLRHPNPGLFSGVAWGTSQVLEQTCSLARSLGISMAQIDLLNDVDRPEDLAIWEESHCLHERIAVIIPTLNSENILNKTLVGIEERKRIQLIVVDGGSRVHTWRIAKESGAKVIYHKANRACQMNIGALSADADRLLFLHRDIELPTGLEKYIENILQRPGTVAGVFRLPDNGNCRGLPLKEINAAPGLFHSGRVAIFLHTKLFWQHGGFNDMPMMEDFELLRRLQNGGTITIVESAANHVDPRSRNLERLGTHLKNQAAVLAYRLGLSPERIDRLYKKI